MTEPGWVRKLHRVVRRISVRVHGGRVADRRAQRIRREEAPEVGGVEARAGVVQAACLAVALAAGEQPCVDALLVPVRVDIFQHPAFTPDDLAPLLFRLPQSVLPESEILTVESDAN